MRPWFLSYDARRTSDRRKKTKIRLRQNYDTSPAHLPAGSDQVVSRGLRKQGLGSRGAWAPPQGTASPHRLRVAVRPPSPAGTLRPRGGRGRAGWSGHRSLPAAARWLRVCDTCSREFQGRCVRGARAPGHRSLVMCWGVCAQGDGEGVCALSGGEWGAATDRCGTGGSRGRKGGVSRPSAGSAVSHKAGP